MAFQDSSRLYDQGWMQRRSDRGRPFDLHDDWGSTILEMIDYLNEVEQDVLEEIDPDLVSYTFSTRGGDQLIYFI